MIVETRKYFQRERNGGATLDKESSVPKHEIADRTAKFMIGFLEEQGCQRHETPTQISFDEILDCHRYAEYIFYK